MSNDYTNPVPNFDDKDININVESEPDYTPMSEVYFEFIDILGFLGIEMCIPLDFLKLLWYTFISQKMHNTITAA